MPAIKVELLSLMICFLIMLNKCLIDIHIFHYHSCISFIHVASVMVMDTVNFRQLCSILSLLSLFLHFLTLPYLHCILLNGLYHICSGILTELYEGTYAKSIKKLFITTIIYFFNTSNPYKILRK